MSLTKATSTVISDGTANSYSFRNLILNGSIDVAQRGTSSSNITTSGYYTADRWLHAPFATWTQTVESDAPTGIGLRNSLRLLCTTSNNSPTSGLSNILSQRFEGQSLQILKKGTSSAENITISFWIKSNVIGTYILEIGDQNNSRSISRSYTVSSSGVWEYKTITFPGDITGVINNDNTFSFTVNFWLGGGSNFTSGTLQTSWGSTVQANRAVGQVNLASATNNYFQITGVQMEIGSVATPFERRPYEVELMRCMRYYYYNQRYQSQGGTAFSLPGLDPIYGISDTFPVTMRSTPTLTFLGLFARSGGTSNLEAISNQGFIWGIRLSGGGTGSFYAYAASGYTANSEL